MSQTQQVSFVQIDLTEHETIELGEVFGEPPVDEVLEVLQWEAQQPDTYWKLHPQGYYFTEHAGVQARVTVDRERHTVRITSTVRSEVEEGSEVHGKERLQQRLVAARAVVGQRVNNVIARATCLKVAKLSDRYCEVDKMTILPQRGDIVESETRIFAYTSA